MKIELHEIPVRALVDGYVNNDEEGVWGYGGKLNIRPPYQREFVYKDKQRDAVIETVRKNFPLNVMYWVDNGNGTFEVMDGQQRTISICEYVKGKFSINFQYFHNLEKEEQEQILDYRLMVYFCHGTAREKLDWFKTINIAGEKLTDQELRNAVYTGEWLHDAKRFFSKTNCPAYQLAKDYMSGSPIRQDYLETALSWIADSKGQTIEEYMAEHQHKPNANELVSHFRHAIDWFKMVFPVYRKEMKGIEIGLLYNKYKDREYDQKYLESRIKELMQDEDVTNKKGIYVYLLSGEDPAMLRHLSIRAFSERMKREAYERQGGICPKCQPPANHYAFEDMEADHIIPWSEGGKTVAENCQMLCKLHNRLKSNV